MKTIYYVASSLDGFIADPDGGVGWLDRLSIDPQASEYEAFYATVDALLMGRATYDFVHDYGQWPYGNQPTWVCTNRELEPLADCNLQSEREPLAAIEQAKEQGVETLWVVGGGRLVGALVEAGLLTHVSVSLMPVLLGDGIRLVDSLPAPVFLEQESSTPMAGFTQVVYRVGKK